MRESHAIIVLFFVGFSQVLPLFDTQRGVKEIWGVKHLPRLFLPSCLDVEGKKYLLLPFLPHLPLHPNRALYYLLEQNFGRIAPVFIDGKVGKDCDEMCAGTFL